MSATAPRETEAGFERAVVDLAQLLGWRVAHFRPARTGSGWSTPVAYDGAGWPDLVLVRGDRALFRELKVGTRKLAAEQLVWLDALHEAGLDANVWRPSQWDEIREELLA